MPEITSKSNITDQDALDFHRLDKPGKLQISATKPLSTARDLSLAYSPGVAVPCLEIEKNPDAAYDYTAKGNMVAIISNGTAVLGLGKLGALASKPVMEGKAVLFKRFADIDGIDIEVDTADVDEFFNCVKFLGKSWGGINLEDIAAPECFMIEQKLSEALDIPVFHDDQHGTAIVATAGLLNALTITGKDIKNFKMVVNGAGAAGIACVELLKAMGMPNHNVIMCDRTGVISKDRTGLDQWKSAHAVDTKLKTLSEALKGADVAFGLSAKGAFTKEMMLSMNKNPIIFAMANPDPEINPDDLKAIRPDAIIATGRSDYPNQVNNVLGFPYIFRGALDVRASKINIDMKIAATKALADLAKQDVPDEVSNAYSGKHIQFGPEYIIPKPFDARLLTTIPPAVAKAAEESGVARKPIKDELGYRRILAARLDKTATLIQKVADRVKSSPKKIVFAEGEQETVIRAALQFYKEGYGTPVLIGREDSVMAAIDKIGLKEAKGIEVLNAALSNKNTEYFNFLYEKLNRKGFLKRDCQRLVNQDRNIFAACMVANGDADGMITGSTRNYFVAYDDITRVIDPATKSRIFGMSIIMVEGRTLFVADTTVHHNPTSEELADIACQTAEIAKKLGYDPRVAMLSFANFGNPAIEGTERVHGAIEVLNSRNVDFEYDGEMTVDVALTPKLLAYYPFSRLSKPANILIMPGLHSANIASRLIDSVGAGKTIGPLLTGLKNSAQIVKVGASVSEIVTLALFAAYDSTSPKVSSSNKKLMANKS
jgi:malate dehydrogenase (oxaloacetate-decarboxylating)(NADP+)